MTLTVVDPHEDWQARAQYAEHRCSELDDTLNLKDQQNEILKRDANRLNNEVNRLNGVLEQLVAEMNHLRKQLADAERRAGRSFRIVGGSGMDAGTRGIAGGIGTHLPPPEGEAS